MYRIAQKPEKTILKNDGSTSPSSTKPSASNIPQISNKNIAAPSTIFSWQALFCLTTKEHFSQDSGKKKG